MMHLHREIAIWSAAVEVVAERLSKGVLVEGEKVSVDLKLEGDADLGGIDGQSCRPWQPW